MGKMTRYTRKNGKLVKIPWQMPYPCTKCHCYHYYGPKYDAHEQFRKITILDPNIDTGEEIA